MALTLAPQLVCNGVLHALRSQRMQFSMLGARARTQVQSHLRQCLGGNLRTVPPSICFTKALNGWSLANLLWQTVSRHDGLRIPFVML